jgi:hypothetical protein
MRINIKHSILFTLITAVIAFGTVAQAQQRVYQVSDRQVQTVLDRIDTRTNTFSREVERTFNAQGAFREDSINTMIANFKNATDNLRNNFASRRSTLNDAQEVMDRARYVNSFMQNNRMSQTASVHWNQIRADLDILAGYYRVQTNWTDATTHAGQHTTYYATDAQMRTLLNRLAQRSTSFRVNYNNWARRNQRNQTQEFGNVSQDVTDFERAITNFRQQFSNRNSPDADVYQVLRHSATINSYLGTNRTNNAVNNSWNLVRNDLNTLASYYRVAWNWNDPVYPGTQFGNFDSRLTGNYRLNTAHSDNVPNMIDRALQNVRYTGNQRDRARTNLERRLQSPETLSFEKRGQQVTMSASNAAPVTLSADGVRRSETSPDGRSTSNVTVASTDREMTINYEGNRAYDYHVSFMPMDNGQLRVTRRIYLDDQTVSITSVYDKVAQTPMWNTAGYPTDHGTDQVGTFVIANNTRMTARLDTPLSTRSARDRDRFSMTVTSPSQYAGAVIEGTIVGEKSGVVSGRATMGLSFETIRMRDNRTYQFAGIVDQVREPNGNMVNVNNEGTVRDDSQTTRTVTRAGIGALIGAIIGGIVDGGSGAAIGAGVGAGAGAGTVILQGRDNLELASGTEFTLTAMAPSSLATQ